MSFLDSQIGRVELTAERRKHITIRHPELQGHLQKIRKVLQHPDEIRVSRYDANVLLFYKYFAKIRGGKYLSVTVKLAERNFVLTAYFTDQIRAGVPYENEKKSS